jgi:hypothetical protein
MASEGKAQLLITFVATPEKVGEVDRLVANHRGWMAETHHHDGSKALLSYNFSKGPELANPLDPGSEDTAAAFGLSVTQGTSLSSPSATRERSGPRLAPGSELTSSDHSSAEIAGFTIRREAIPRRDSATTADRVSLSTQATAHAAAG